MNSIKIIGWSYNNLRRLLPKNELYLRCLKDYYKPFRLILGVKKEDNRVFLLIQDIKPHWIEPNWSIHQIRKEI